MRHETALKIGIIGGVAVVVATAVHHRQAVLVALCNVLVDLSVAVELSKLQHAVAGPSCHPPRLLAAAAAFQPSPREEGGIEGVPASSGEQHRSL